MKVRRECNLRHVPSCRAYQQRAGNIPLSVKILLSIQDPNPLMRSGAVQSGTTMQTFNSGLVQRRPKIPLVSYDELEQSKWSNSKYFHSISNSQFSISFAPFLFLFGKKSCSIIISSCAFSGTTRNATLSFPPLSSATLSSPSLI
jgi:hypothetical protein